MAEVATVLVGLPGLDNTATDMESLIVLFALVQYLNPAVIVEAGTYQGHFAVGCARMLPNSTVYTADPVPYPLPEVPNLRAFTGDFEAMLDANPDIRGQVGFAFIDSGGGGSGPDVRWRHWNAAKTVMAPKGVMACHDTKGAANWKHGNVIVGESLHLIGGRGVALWQAA